MSREIKFRAFSTVNNSMWPVRSIIEPREHTPNGSVKLARENNPSDDGEVDVKLVKLMQFTGLQDKNGNTSVEVYEGDIIDVDGKVKGNIYEMDAGETDLVIQGFGTKTWFKTYNEAISRGCYDSE